MSLSKTAVIFGVGPGIGIAAAREFAALGYRLALVARTRSKLEWLVAQFEAAGTSAKGFVADGGDGASVDAVVPEIRKWAEGDPSVVLFNAFTSQPAGPTHKVSPAGFARSLLVDSQGNPIDYPNHPFRGAKITTVSKFGELVALATNYPKIPGKKTRLPYYVDEALKEAGYDVCLSINPAAIRLEWEPRLRLLTGNGPQSIDVQTTRLRSLLS